MSVKFAHRLAAADLSSEVIQWIVTGYKRYLEEGADLYEALQLDRPSRLRQRNAALRSAAELLDLSDGPWNTAGRLAKAIKRFERRMLPLYQRGEAEPSPIDRALLDAFETGARIPKTQRGLYEALR